mgnify:CR=1 FL=1
MPVLLVSFIAGFLTIAAPCILPVLPVVIGGSVTAQGDASRKRPLVIIGSLAVSVFVFTLLLKASTSLLGIPQEFWQTVSGLILVLLGGVFLFPTVWEHVAGSLNARSAQLLQKASTSSTDYRRDILLGLALGPVFNSCSPTYALIVATVLPAAPLTGLLYLTSYVLGLSVALLLVAKLGQALVTRLGWAANPRGWFHRIVGILLIVTGVTIVFGLDKQFQAYVLEQGWYDAVSGLEERFR